MFLISSVCIRMEDIGIWENTGIMTCSWACYASPSAMLLPFSPFLIKRMYFSSETRIILSFSSSIHLFCWNQYVQYTSPGYALSHSLHGKELLNDLALIIKK